MNLFDSRYVNLRRDLDRLARERDPNRPNGDVARSFEKALTQANLTRDVQGTSANKDELSQVLQSEDRWKTRSALAGRIDSQPLSQAREPILPLRKNEAQSRQSPEHAGGQTSTGKDGAGQSRFAETRFETQPWSRRSVLQRDADRPTGEESRFHAAKQQAAQPQPDPTPQKRSGKSPQQHEPQSHETPGSSLQRQSRQVLPRSFKRPDQPANRQSRAGNWSRQVAGKPADGSKQPQTRQALQGQQQQAQPDVRQGPGSSPHNTQRTRTPDTGAERSANAPEEKGGLNARSADSRTASTREFTVRSGSDAHDVGFAKDFAARSTFDRNASVQTKGLPVAAQADDPAQGADFDPPVANSGQQHFQNSPDPDIPDTTNKSLRPSARNKMAGQASAHSATGPQQGNAVDMGAPDGNTAPEPQSTQLQTRSPGVDGHSSLPDEEPLDPMSESVSIDPRSRVPIEGAYAGHDTPAASMPGVNPASITEDADVMAALGGQGAGQVEVSEMSSLSDPQSLLQDEDSDDDVALPLHATLGFMQRPVPVTMGSDSSVERVTEARLGAAGSGQTSAFQTGACNESGLLTRGVLASQTSGTKGPGSLISSTVQLTQKEGKLKVGGTNSGSTTEQGTSARSARDGASAEPNAKASDLPEASGNPSSQLDKNEKDTDSWIQTPVETPHVENPNAPSETPVLANQTDKQSTTASRSTWHAIDELSSLMSNWERLSGTDREAHQLRVVSGIDGVAGIELRRDEQGRWLLTLQMEPGRPLMDPRARQDLMQRLEKRGHVLAELEEKEYLNRYRHPREH